MFEQQKLFEKRKRSSVSNQNDHVDPQLIITIMNEVNNLNNASE